MPNTHHVTEFAGLPVVEFPSLDTLDRVRQGGYLMGGGYYEPCPTQATLEAALADPGSVAWRLRKEVRTKAYPVGQDDPLEDVTGYVARFTEKVDLSAVSALTVGYMPQEPRRMRAEETVDALVGLAPGLTKLRSLFFGEVLWSEDEISWIQLCDLAPLVTALPALEELVVRGGTGDLGLRVPEHRSLRRLTVQSGALRPDVVRDVCASGLPGLEHLELWLGVRDYGGGGTTPEDLEPVLSGKAFPALRSLGLRNVEDLRSWFPVLAKAPVIAALDNLDLSLGDLTDEGAQDLVEAAPAFRGLCRLDLHHHFLSEDMCERVREALPGVEADLSEVQEPEIDEDDEDDEPYYYTAVSE